MNENNDSDDLVKIDQNLKKVNEVYIAGLNSVDQNVDTTSMLDYRHEADSLARNIISSNPTKNSLDLVLQVYSDNGVNGKFFEDLKSDLEKEVEINSPQSVEQSQGDGNLHDLDQLIDKQIDKIGEVVDLVSEMKLETAKGKELIDSLRQQVESETLETTRLEQIEQDCGMGI